MHQYARLKKTQVSSLRFLFDGEDVHNNDTADSLDMESGDCMDVLEVVCLDISWEEEYFSTEQILQTNCVAPSRCCKNEPV